VIPWLIVLAPPWISGVWWLFKVFYRYSHELHVWLRHEVHIYDWVSWMFPCGDPESGGSLRYSIDTEIQSRTPHMIESRTPLSFMDVLPRKSGVWWLFWVFYRYRYSVTNSTYDWVTNFIYMIEFHGCWSVVALLGVLCIHLYSHELHMWQSHKLHIYDGVSQMSGVWWLLKVFSAYTCVVTNC